MRGAAIVLALGVALGSGCNDRPTLPPYGQVLFVVDTDLPVPAIAGRLRVDVYSQDGTWQSSRDFPRPDPSDWPASFTVYTAATASSGGDAALVRLRAFPDGAVRDYEGERYVGPVTSGKPGALVPEPDGMNLPRLVQEGADITPPTEPEPPVTVDRLLLVPLTYGHPERVAVTLQGACAGTMADLAGMGTCVDQGGTLAPVVPFSASDAVTGQATSVTGTFGVGGPCTVAARPAGTDPTGAPLYDDDVCVAGNAFVFGQSDQSLSVEAVPERVAVIPTMLVDRYEVTVARWRDRVRRGFAAPSLSPVLTNDGPLPTSEQASPPEQTLCTFSTQPLTGADSREAFPITCVPYAAARAFCQHEGGDLLTEAEWEYAATAATGAKTTYPWGYDDPTCTGVVFGRDDVQRDGDTTCTSSGLPFGVEDVSHGVGDVTPGLGLRGMGANVQEWVKDSADPYASVCWMSQPLTDPSCQDSAAVNRSVRGGSWRNAASSLYATLRSTLPDLGLTIDVGFRCMRKGVSP